ncbi:MAG: carboxypeptidase-like regulatory domain-containing protein, partial [Bacilli bacterium]
MIPRPTVLLLLLACLPVSGAGRYPWLAVAGIYAVPVAWNLVVIAGHTGFHVVPAVVYASVAVVCAVGVWRAARPRPEALTMPANHPNPRPAGPPSTAPPIASPRPGGATLPSNRPRSIPRPAAGGFLSMIALAVVLLIAAVPAVSAEVILDQEMAEFEDTGGTISVSKSSHSGANSYVNKIYLKNIQDVTDLHYIIFTIDGNDGAALSTFPFTHKGESGSWPVSFTLGGQAFDATLYKTYQRNYLGTITATRYAIYFDEWDIGTLTGTQYLQFTEPFFWTTADSYIPMPTNDLIWLDGTSNKKFVDYAYTITISCVKDWKNRLIVTSMPGGYDVVLQRQYDAMNYASRLTALKNDASVYYQERATDFRSAFATSEIDTIKISSASTDYLWPLASGGTEDPDTATVTVYIQNSQTGALLANSHLSILAATGGTETEVVNATLPGGTGTYSLEKADYLKYHATATAPGYTLLSPILFGVPEGGTTIVLWMAPDAPPDVPTEPEKSMLYGYIQTQGSQQPISGATVSLDGYGSTTTSSTGFYLFNNVTPGSYSITASAPLHDALSEPVTVDPAATPHNLALKGHFLLTVSAKDADDLTTLHNTTISLSDGQESTQNPATFNVDYGPYTITAAAGGYYPQAQSVYLNNPGTTTATVLP